MSITLDEFTARIPEGQHVEEPLLDTFDPHGIVPGYSFLYKNKALGRKAFVIL